jgi:serine phosphatase RsbU (regulator of sigma subunit)
MTEVTARTAIAVIAGSFVAITAIRLVFGEPGPLYAIPAVLAGLWLGRSWALGSALLAAALWAITTGGDWVAGAVIRLAIYSALGVLVASLAQSSRRLAREVARKDLELEELRAIQEALAPPEPPERPALELATCYLPAEHGVSGDFFLVAPAAGDATVIAIGDVAGRGIDAAKRAWYVRTVLASSAELSEDPGTMLERANHSLIEDAVYSAPFVTVACLVFHPDGELDWALAGHDDPIVLGVGEALDPGGRRGLPLGVADRLGCETATARVSDGSGLLLYTDGLTEARRRPGGNGSSIELFGEERLRLLIRELDGVAPAEVVEKVQKAVRSFSGGALADDLCLVALRPASRPETTEVC